MIKKDIFIIRKGDQVVDFEDSYAETADFLGITLSAVSKAVKQKRATRSGFSVEKKPRVYLCRIGQKEYALRNVEGMGKDWVAYLDISECYYGGEFVRK